MVRDLITMKQRRGSELINNKLNREKCSVLIFFSAFRVLQ